MGCGGKIITRIARDILTLTSWMCLYVWKVNCYLSIVYPFKTLDQWNNSFAVYINVELCVCVQVALIKCCKTWQTFTSVNTLIQLYLLYSIFLHFFQIFSTPNLTLVLLPLKPLIFTKLVFVCYAGLYRPVGITRSYTTSFGIRDYDF